MAEIPEEALRQLWVAYLTAHGNHDAPDGDAETLDALGEAEFDILDWLRTNDPATVLVDIAAHYRREALEEAARVADAKAENAAKSIRRNQNSLFSRGVEAISVEIARQIRALKEKPNG